MNKAWEVYPGIPTVFPVLMSTTGFHYRPSPLLGQDVELAVGVGVEVGTGDLSTHLHNICIRRFPALPTSVLINYLWRFCDV